MDNRQAMNKAKRDAQPAKFNLKTFMSLLKDTKPKYWQLWIGLFLGMIATGMQLVVPTFAKNLINGFQHSVDGKLVAVMIIVFLASAVISAASGSLLGFFGEDIVSELRKKIWDKLLTLHVNYFDENKSGEMTSRLVNDSTQVKDLLARAFPSLVTSLLSIVGALVLMIVMDWKMTAIVFLAIPIVMLVMIPIGRQSHKVGRARQDALADFSGDAGDVLSEIRLVKSSNSEKQEAASGYGEIEKLYRIGLKEVFFDSVAGPIMTAVMMGMFVGVLAYGASRVAAGTLSMGAMFSFLMYMFQIIGPAATLGSFFTTLAKASGSTQRIQNLLLEQEEDLEAGKYVDIEGESLEMKHVDFAYDDSKQILKDINFEAQPNTVVAFAGPSGGGKSTVFSLLERFYEPTNGEITVAGKNVNDISLHSWREQIGFVSQDSAILAGTIRDNLTYGLDDEYSDDQLWDVLKLAFADGFVKEMPDQLDTEVGERGVKVSGGQRQRIAIARAFLRNPKILMLDEATASLDSESEAMVQKALDQLMKGRTTLVIAHRLSTIVDANKIYFIEHGSVSGSGTHYELVKNHELYREYVETQFNQD